MKKCLLLSFESRSLACENREEHTFFFKTSIKNSSVKNLILRNKHVSSPGSREGMRGSEKLDKRDTELWDVRWAMSHPL